MLFNYKRRSTVSVNVGGIAMGGEWPVRVQSMTNTATDDIQSSAAQCQLIAYAGADYVRLTAQGVKQAQSIGEISRVLRAQGCDIPLIADIHFNPQAAMAAAEVCEGVRINPGNFVDPARTFKQLEYTQEEYDAELKRVREALLPFIKVCREHHMAVRLGVNHGSLSDRIMSRYGNTAAGMVESVMEFLRVFVEEQFMDVVISMKASNVVVMVEAVRRLVDAMDREDMHFPLHLGVTEAGFGEDGRVKSAVGIGALMAQGLGDTIRVSLSEEPELEVPVARKLVDYIMQREGQPDIVGEYAEGYDPLCPMRRKTVTVNDRIGGNRPPVVIASYRPDELNDTALVPDFYYCANGLIDGMHRFLAAMTLLRCGHAAEAPHVAKSQRTSGKPHEQKKTQAKAHTDSACTPPASYSFSLLNCKLTGTFIPSNSLSSIHIAHRHTGQPTPNPPGSFSSAIIIS